MNEDIYAFVSGFAMTVSSNLNMTSLHTQHAGKHEMEICEGEFHISNLYFKI